MPCQQRKKVESRLRCLLTENQLQDILQKIHESANEIEKQAKIKMKAEIAYKVIRVTGLIIAGTVFLPFTKGASSVLLISAGSIITCTRAAQCAHNIIVVKLSQLGMKEAMDSLRSNTRQMKTENDAIGDSEMRMQTVTPGDTDIFIYALSDVAKSTLYSLPSIFGLPFIDIDSLQEAISTVSDVVNEFDNQASSSPQNLLKKAKVLRKCARTILDAW